MEKFQKLSQDKVEIINSIVSGSPNFVPLYPWLKIYPCNPTDFFDNSDYLSKTVAAGIITSGAAVSGIAPIYSLDIVRKDGNIFDIDRHLLILSGSIILKQREIHKDFPEHHTSEIPFYY